MNTDPTYAYTHLGLSDAYFAKGTCDQGVKENLTYTALTGDPKLAEIGEQAYAKSGCKGLLLARIAHESDSSDLEYYDPYRVATDYALLDDKEKAFYWLQRSYTEHVGMGFVKVDPVFDSLHSDPRFAALLKRIGFPQ
jgi:hypothetical protein